jgi:glycosyltransferase involved in cell wall biosynthesis
MESVPPRLYGGTERVVSYLTEALVLLGHDVTLFASSDSITNAKLVACSPSALRLAPSAHDALAYHIKMLAEVRRRANEFDVLHFHIDLLHYLMIEGFAHRTVTTLHGRLDLAEQRGVYAVLPKVPLVSISREQRCSMPPVNWVGCVHHGLPSDVLRLNSRPSGDYLAFLGRISPEKRPDRAIEIAVRCGRRLRMAAKVEAVDRHYWEQRIEPLVRSHPNVEFIGEIGEADKAEFLGNAAALLFPIDWSEPFGLVMIEAMACGTPVIAWRSGSVPEVIDEARTGFMVRSIEEAIEAIAKVEKLDRTVIRSAFERRFTADRMARDYVAIYQALTTRLVPVPSATVEATA